MILDCKKFYIRSCPGIPDSEMMGYARKGFWAFGLETKDYVSVSQIPDAGPDVGVAGTIKDVVQALKAIGLKRPPLFDYPPELEEFLGRKVWPGVLSDVRQIGRPVFVKPAESQKLFTGFVWEGDNHSDSILASYEDNIKVWFSDPVKFVSEYRTFCHDGEILDCRRYTGDWSLAPNKSTVEAAVKAFLPAAPRAFTLDFGVTESGETLLVEANDGFAIGHYGLFVELYARMLSARWNEMVTKCEKITLV